MDESSDLHLTDEHYAAIGRVIVNWTDLEWRIQLMIWDELNFPIESGPAITAHMSFPLMLDILSSLIKLRYGAENHRAFKTLRGQVEALYGRRNAIAHSAWSDLNGKLELVHIKSRGQLLDLSQEMPPDKILEIARSIDEVYESLDDFFESLHSLPPPSPHKSGEVPG